MRVKRGNFDFEGEEWEHISDESKKLISKCLQVNPDLRPSCEEILDHNFFKININESNIKVETKVGTFVNN